MKLPEKLKTGDDFKGGVFEKINALIDYCKSSEIRGDNRTVRINRTPSGITISALPQNCPAASGGGTPGEYNGMFKLALDSQEVSGEGSNMDYYVIVVDGATYDAATSNESHICGIVIREGETFPVRTVRRLLLKGEKLFIYAVHTKNGFEIAYSSEELSGSTAMPMILLGSVDYTSEYPKITQIHITNGIWLAAGYEGMFSPKVRAVLSNEREITDYEYYIQGGTAYVNSTQSDGADVSWKSVPQDTTYVYYVASYNSDSESLDRAQILSQHVAASDTKSTKYVLLFRICRSESGVKVFQNTCGQVQVLIWGSC